MHDLTNGVCNFSLVLVKNKDVTFHFFVDDRTNGILYLKKMLNRTNLLL